MFLSRLGQDLASVCWEDILQDFDIPFKRRSSGVLVVLCQFHGEKTASLHCWPRSKRFYCFGCGWGGDMIDFVYRKMFEELFNLECLDPCTLQKIDSAKAFFDQIQRKLSDPAKPRLTRLII